MFFYYNRFIADRQQDDIRLSRSWLSFQLIELALAVFIIYLPSFTLCLVLMYLLLGVAIPVGDLVLSIVGCFLYAVILMEYLVILMEHFGNFFNLFNMLMDVHYIVSGVMYPLALLPLIFARMGWGLFINKVFFFLDSGRWEALGQFGILLTLHIGLLTLINRWRATSWGTTT